MKKVKKHQANPSLALLSKPFEFIENKSNSHAEIAILNAAFDHCASHTLYIGVSKRPCYCCSLFFKAVEENKGVKFNISISSTNGNVFNEWNKIDGFLDKEFNQVYEKVLEQRENIELTFPENLFNYDDLSDSDDSDDSESSDDSDDL